LPFSLGKASVTGDRQVGDPTKDSGHGRYLGGPTKVYHLHFPDADGFVRCLHSACRQDVVNAFGNQAFPEFFPIYAVASATSM
jgi:hypothetical protein